MTKVVVIGAGQDGSYMAEYLLANTTHEVVVATRRTSQDSLPNLAAVIPNSRARLATVDLNDAHSISSLVQSEKPDYLINLGGSTFVPDSFNAPAQVMQTNGTALIHLLEAVRQFVPHCRVFSAGSSTEADGKSVYAVSKIAAGSLCRVYRERYGLYVVHGIMHNHCSPRQSELFLPRKVAKGVARIARAIKDGQSFEPIELGNLDARVDLSWAGDFVDGIWRMLNQEAYNVDLIPAAAKASEEAGGNPNGFKEDRRRFYAAHAKEYVLSSGETHSVREFVDKAFAVAGIKTYWSASGSPEEYAVAWEPSTVSESSTPAKLIRINPTFYRPADVALLQGDSTPARQELGWSPQVSFDELVRRMVRADLAEVGL